MKKDKFLRSGLVLVFLLLLVFSTGFAQKEPYRVGTTTANFLEIGYGSAGNGMGDAIVSTVDDLSAIYWNPAGLAYMRQNGVQFMMQPWIADINTMFTSVGMVSPRYGTFAIGIYQVDYGREEVTTMDMQDGTGEHYSAVDYCFSLSYGRKLTDWFAFGASTKLVTSRIWHTTANAFALDLGAIVNTQFFSPTGNREDGMAIGMSISNYGTRMKYDGMDLLQPIDPTPNESGDYDNVEGQYRMQGWELPLIFRLGFAIHPIVIGNNRLTLEVDALHPNNNSESVNVGAEYQYTVPSFGSFYLRSGYKGLFMNESEYGLAFGAGVIYRMRSLNNMAMRIDYAYRDIGVLGTTNCYTFTFVF
ncbi:MAG TPA: PorV/PorQ family protein [bacterium]|nr:PorV/PorQ family protein [bacterium]HPN43701.1 PorV/PorQ family protein [bacterium]